MELSFILVTDATDPDPAAVIASGARLGLAMRHTGDAPLSFDVEGRGQLIAMLMPGPHPDVPHMPTGVTSPATDVAAAAPAHFVLTALEVEGSPRERDLVMAALTATIIDNTDAVGAMLGHGSVFHKAPLFAEMAALGIEQGELPVEIAVDIRVARESETLMSFLTHGMERYGREELYVTCPIQGTGALDFVFGLVRWMLSDLERPFPTGDTVGRSAEEKLVIQRVDNPTGEGQPVIRLDLPG